MTATLHERAEAVYELGIQLPDEEREDVAHRLLESLEPTDPDSELTKRAWQEEIQRRIDSVKSGKAKCYSLEESMAYLRQALAETTIL